MWSYRLVLLVFLWMENGKWKKNLNWNPTEENKASIIGIFDKSGFLRCVYIYNEHCLLFLLGSLSQISASARHGRVNAFAYLGSNNRNSSTSSKIKVDLDSSTGTTFF